MTPKRTVRVVGALIRRGELLLVTQRPPAGSFADHWEFPGGKVEPGEADEAALAREIAEELGVQVAVGDLYHRAVHEYAGFVVDFRVYECRLGAEAEPRAVQVQDLMWIQPSAIPALRFPPADLPVLEKLIAEAGP